MALAKTTYILPLTTVYRQRLLPASGAVVVRQGQKVAPNDTIATANIAAEHVLLDVARALRIAPKKADQYIDRTAGEHVAEGDLIASGSGGLVRRSMRAPCDGRIVYIRNGQILLQRAESPFELKAGYAGVISDVIPDRGANVEMFGALIQCVWGNGLVEFGAMQNTAEAPNTVLKLEHVDVSLRGGILVGGHLEDVETLNALAEIPIRGLILGSMLSSLLPVARKVPFPIVLTDGFGRLPMNKPAFRLLSTNSGREVSINAELFDIMRGTRPELVIPLPISGKPGSVPLPRDLAPNQRVRYVRAPYASRVGSILSLLPDLVTFPSGIRTQAAEVRLDSGEQILAPLANLEVFEYK
ncbi:MAG: hypothetical protein ACK2UW_12755 [Anaerolineales bacterium]|jgi:hypothetical protein